MKVYSLTGLGKKLCRTHGDDGTDEMRILHYVHDNKTATDDEIEIRCGGRWALRGLVKRGLIKELTT